MASASSSLLPSYLEFFSQIVQPKWALDLIFELLRVKTGDNSISSDDYWRVREPILEACKKYEGKSELTGFFKEVGAIFKGTVFGNFLHLPYTLNTFYDRY